MYSIWKILWMHRNIFRCFPFLSFPDHLLTHVILRSGYLAYINSFIVHILLRCSKGLGLNILLISRERGNLTCRMGLDNFQEEASVTHCFFLYAVLSSWASTPQLQLSSPWPFFALICKEFSLHSLHWLSHHFKSLEFPELSFIPLHGEVPIHYKGPHIEWAVLNA